HATPHARRASHGMNMSPLRLLLLATVALASVSTGSASAQTAPDPRDLFEKVAIGSTTGTLTRWDKPVRLAIVGDRASDFRPALDSLVKEISAITPIKFEFTNSSVNFFIVVTQNVYAEMIGKYHPGVRALFRSDEAFDKAADDVGDNDERCF